MYKPIRFILFFSIILLFNDALYAQKQIQGWVIDGESKALVPQVHVINKTTQIGTVTNAQGSFSLSLDYGDTILFSNIAYKYFYFVYTDSSAILKDVVIEMEEQNYLLNEVSIFSYNLTSNKAVSMEIGAADYPFGKAISDHKLIEMDAKSNLGALYNLFGSKPRQLKILAELKEAEKYREKLEESNNRESAIALTGLTLEELEAFMFYCKYAPVHMRSMNDYAFLKSVQACYKQYVKEQELEDFLGQFD